VGGHLNQPKLPNAVQAALERAQRRTPMPEWGPGATVVISALVVVSLVFFGIYDAIRGPVRPHPVAAGTFLTPAVTTVPGSVASAPASTPATTVAPQTLQTAAVATVTGLAAWIYGLEGINVVPNLGSNAVTTLGGPPTLSGTPSQPPVISGLVVTPQGVDSANVSATVSAAGLPSFHVQVLFAKLANIWTAQSATYSQA